MPLLQPEWFERLSCVDAERCRLLCSSATPRCQLHPSVIDQMDNKRNNMALGVGALMYHTFHVFSDILIHKLSHCLNVKVQTCRWNISMPNYGHFSADLRYFLHPNLNSDLCVKYVPHKYGFVLVFPPTHIILFHIPIIINLISLLALTLYSLQRAYVKLTDSFTGEACSLTSRILTE